MQFWRLQNIMIENKELILILICMHIAIFQALFYSIIKYLTNNNL